MSLAVIGQTCMVGLALFGLLGNELPAVEMKRGQPVPADRLARLRHGVNLSHWFAYVEHALRGRTEEEHFSSFITAQDLKLIRGAGFDHVRLPFEPRLIMDKTTGLPDPARLRLLDDAIQLILRHGLAVVVDAHAEGAFCRALHAPKELARFADFWKAVATRFARHDPGRVLLEVLNEPAVGEWSIENWPAAQEVLIAAMRAGAPRHTIVANPGGWQAIWELRAITPGPDCNVAYSVHYYEPFYFCNQGATWMSADIGLLRQMPWPLDVAGLEAALGRVATSGKPEELAAARNRVSESVRKGDATEAWMQWQVKSAADWSSAHARPVLVGEFGVLGHSAPPVDRDRWYRTMTAACTAGGIGWTLWDFGGFSGLTSGDPGARRLDPAILSALGLSPSKRP